MMKRSSLAPPPPAKRSRAPGESDIGDEDDGRVSSESTLRPGSTTLAANQATTEAVSRSNIMFLLNDGDHQHDDTHRTSQAVAAPSLTIDTQAGAAVGDLSTSLAQLKSPSDSKPIAPHSADVVDTPVSGGGVAVVASPVVATAVMAKPTPVVSATSATTPTTPSPASNAENSDSMMVDTPDAKASASTNQASSTEQQANTANPSSAANKPKTMPRPFFPLDFEDEQPEGLQIWETHPKKKKKKKDKRRNQFARRGQLDDLVAATDGDAVGMNLPGRSLLGGPPGADRRFDRGAPLNGPGVPNVGRPTVEYDDINDRVVRGRGAGPRRGSLSGFGPPARGFGAAPGVSNAPVPASAQRPAVNLMNPRLSASRDQTATGAFPSGRFSGLGGSPSTSQPNFFSNIPPSIPPSPSSNLPLTLSTQQTEYDWHPRLRLPAYSSQLPGPEYPPTVELRTKEVIPVLGRRFLLEREYVILGVLPRSCYASIHQLQVKYSFVFQLPQHPWFEDLAGMRKSAYFIIRESDSKTRWEVHLKPSRDKQMLFGYICEPAALRNCAIQQIHQFLNARRLPLVLDLDDTLVRLVSDEDPMRYVPEKDAAKVPERVRKLRDGRRVVVTPGVEEFLEWATTLFDVSVCSLGEQTYVTDVTEMLDPNKTRIQGLRHSARQELDFAISRGAHNTPPKNLDALYNFCYMPVPSITQSDGTLVPSPDGIAVSPWHNTTIGSVLSSDTPTNGIQHWTYQPFFGIPLIVDDTTRSWPMSQQDNIIMVRERRHRPKSSRRNTAPNGVNDANASADNENDSDSDKEVWSVDLMTWVKDVLTWVHTEFFRRYDRTGIDAVLRGQVTPVVIYKEWLRGLLAEKIARGS